MFWSHGRIGYRPSFRLLWCLCTVKIKLRAESLGWDHTFILGFEVWEDIIGCFFTVGTGGFFLRKFQLGLRWSLTLFEESVSPRLPIRQNPDLSYRPCVLESPSYIYPYSFLCPWAQNWTWYFEIRTSILNMN